MHKTLLFILFLVFVNSMFSQVINRTLRIDTSEKSSAISSSSARQNENFSHYTIFFGDTWTCGGNLCIGRTLLQFDLSFIKPEDSLISAHLSLYADPVCQFDGYYGSPTYGTNNAGWLRRITESWNQDSVVWVNQPPTTAINEVNLPQSTSTTQDYPNLDITMLLRDIMKYGNNGIMIMENNEVNYYNSLIFGSGDNPDSTLHPLLQLTYFIPSGQAQFSASDSIICQNSTITFTDQSTLTPIGWNWTFIGGTPATSDIQNPTIIYDTPGTYLVKLVTSYGSGDDSITKTSFITVLPKPVTGSISATNNDICINDTVYLRTTGTIADSTEWQSSLTGYNFANAGSGSFYNTVPDQTTFFRIIAFDNNCTDTSAIYPVIVNSLLSPPLLVTSDSLICASDSTVITSSESYSSYHWNNGDTRPYTYANSAGNYWVTVTDIHGCSAVSNPQSINVYPVPSVSIEVEGDTLLSFGQIAYQWYLNSSAINGATSSVYVAEKQGVYAVAVKDTNGCTTISNPVDITGISQIDNGQLFNIFPNPSTVAWQLLASDNLLNSHIELYNPQGRIVYLADIRYLISEIPNNELPSGIYWLRLHNDGINLVKKLVKLN